MSKPLQSPAQHVTIYIVTTVLLLLVYSNALDGSGFRIESQSLMPIWLRDLWPTHDFDPRAIWDADKQKAIEAAADVATDKAAAAAADGSSTKKSSKAAPKAKVVNKKELIQAENAKKLYEVCTYIIQMSNA
jgi:hypothetical protein